MTAPSPRPSAFVRVAGIVGVLSLCPVACASTIAWVKYSGDASATPTASTAAELVGTRVSAETPFEVTLTPDLSRQLDTLNDSERAVFLVGVEEDPAFILTSPVLPAEGTQSFIVHRDTHIIVGTGRLEGGAFASALGREASDVSLFAQADPRTSASGEATIAGWAALLGWAIGLASLSAAVVVARRTRRALPKT